MRGTDNAALASVLGALADAAAAGDPTSADTLMQYVKQLVNVLVGTAGVTTFPAAVAPGNGVSLAEALRATYNFAVSSAAWGSINSGIVFRGTVTAADPGVSFTVGGLAGQGVGAFIDANTPWYAYCFRDAGGAAAAPQGEQQQITGYTSATGLFITNDFTVPIAVGDDMIMMSGRLAAIPDILADTVDIQTQIGTAGAGLTDLGGMSTAMKAEVQAECDDALTNYSGASGVPTADAVATLLAQLLLMQGTGFATGTDSLEAIRNQGDVAWITGAGGDATEAKQDTLIAALAVVDGIVDNILLDSDELQGDWKDGGRLDLLLDAVSGGATVNITVEDREITVE
jgi:hypothetical protein